MIGVRRWWTGASLLWIKLLYLFGRMMRNMTFAQHSIRIVNALVSDCERKRVTDHGRYQHQIFSPFSESLVDAIGASRCLFPR